MATDAKFDKIQKIIPHTNSENLEIAIVSNYPCVVRKGEFSENEWCFYIREDSSLIGYTEKQDELKKMKDSGFNIPENFDDLFTPSFKWQAPILKYLGSNGRVRAVKLRKEISFGILLKTNVVCPNILRFDDDVAEHFNKNITDINNGSVYLLKNFGIKHWEAPIQGASVGCIDARGGLCHCVQKSDEENVQNIPDEDIPWGEEVLQTMKLDGTSCTILSTPDGDVHVMSRSMDLKLECNNIYNKAAKDIIPLVVTLAKHYNKTIALRGEVCGQGINANKVNKEAKDKNLTFNMYAVNFPEDPDYVCRVGLFGTPWHFLEVNKVCKEITGLEIKTVPVNGVVVLTRELVDSIIDMPADIQEGSVFNTKSTILPHFKVKSKDYILKLG